MPIVCGTDFTENGARSLAAAFALSRQFGEKLVAAHVLEGGLVGRAGEGLLKSVKDRAHALLSEEARRLGDAEVMADVDIRPGPPDEALADLGRDAKARFIVVSALGRRTRPWWKLGGTAERLAERSSVPVLVVREPAPFEKWSRGEGPLRILLAVGRDAPSAAAARWVATLRQAGPCDVTVLSFYSPVQERHRLGLGGPVFATASIPEAEKVIEREIRELVGEQPSGGKLDFLTLAAMGEPAPHIVRMAESLKSDLVVVGTHQRHGLSLSWSGSVSRGVLLGAACAVACVPQTGAPAAAPAAPPRVRTLLAATDFSDTGNRAVQYAHLLAPPGGTVHVLHVIEAELDRVANPMYVPFISGKKGDAEERQRLAQAMAAKLSELVPAWAENEAVETRVEVVEAPDAAEAVLQACARVGADAICLGTTGRTAVGRTVFGSVAERVLHESLVPVLVVPRP